MSCKRIFLFFLVLILFLTPIVSVAQTNETVIHNEENTRFTTIATANATITKSGITVTCSATLKAKYSTNLKIVMVLQKSTSNGWTDVKTWTKTGTGTTLVSSESRVINILYTYRLKVTFTAGSESVTVYSYY